MHLIPRYIDDGTCRMLNALIKYADQKRFRIFVGILSNDDFSVRPLSELGAVSIQFEMRHFADLSVIRPLTEKLSKLRIQVLHTHRVRPDIVGRIAGHRAGVPVNVSTQHYLGEWDERGRVIGLAVRFLYKRTLPYTQKIVNISAMEMERMKRESIPADALEVIHNGVDGEIFYPEEGVQGARASETGNAGPVIGCVAFLTKRKGIHHLIAAFRKVLESYPHARLRIIGDGEERRSLQAQIGALDLGANVELLGKRTDIRSLMNGFDIFVLPSLWEPFGLVIAEAMACGKAVVATKVGGIPEIVDDGVTGLLVPPAESHSLAHALVALIRDEGRRKSLGRAGRQRYLDRFDARIMSAKYEALYDQLLLRADAADDAPVQGSRQRDRGSR